MNLPQDTLNEIMKHIDDLPTLMFYCNINKETLKLCSSKNFWQFKLEPYDLPMPKNKLSLSQWFKLYSFIMDIDKWLTSDEDVITFDYNNSVGEDKVMPLILQYEAYSRSGIPIGNKKYKLRRIGIRRHIHKDSEEYFVSIYFKGMDGYNGGIFKQGLVQFLYQLQLLHL